MLIALVALAGAAPEARSTTGQALQWELQNSGVTVSLRGLSAVDHQVAWASGGAGTWLRTIDGGASWQHGQIPGAESLGVRDVHAFDRQRALALTIGSPGRVYRTDDGGSSWQLAYEDARPEVFFNCMDFADRERGYAVGDPIDGSFLFIETTDGGNSWAPLPTEYRPVPLEGEAQFAASGTCLQARGDNIWIGTGGSVARIFKSTNRGRAWTTAPTPLQQGSASTGVFGVLLDPDGHGIAVGGDYTLEADATAAIALSHDGGESWSADGIVGLGGFRSAVVGVDGGTNMLIAVGPQGSDVSYDAGRAWTAVDGPGFHVVSATPDGAVWAAGGAGRVARLRRQ